MNEAKTTETNVERFHRTEGLDQSSAASWNRLWEAQQRDLAFVESFSDWLDHNHDALRAPRSFDEWLEQNNDALVKQQQKQTKVEMID